MSEEKKPHRAQIFFNFGYESRTENQKIAEVEISVHKIFLILIVLPFISQFARLSCVRFSLFQAIAKTGCVVADDDLCVKNFIFFLIV